MNFANCRKCKKPFVETSSQFCEVCQNIMSEEFRNIRDYLYSNPNCDINQVAQATKIPVRRIFDYIREGRIGLNSK